MKDNEEKIKEEKTKLADNEKRYMVIMFLTISFSLVSILLCGFLLTKNNSNTSKLKGALNVSECEAYVDNIKEETAKLSWSCSRGKVKAYSVYVADDEGNVGLKLPFSTKITSKPNGSTTVKKLSSGTQYVIRLLTSDNKFIKTEPFTTEGEATLKIKAKSITGDSLTVTWDSTSLKSAAKKITLNTLDEDTPKEIGSKIAFTKKGVTTFRKLKPSTEYQACVQLKDDTVQCEIFKTRDKYNVSTVSALNSVTVTWGSKDAKLTKIEIFDAYVDEEAGGEYIYDETNPIKTKEYSKPKKAGAYTARKLTHGVYYVVKATFDDGHVVTKNKKVLTSHKYFVTSTDKDIIVAWADTKSKVTNITVSLLDEYDEEVEVVREENYENGKKAGYLKVTDLQQDSYYIVSVTFADKTEPVKKVIKTIYAYNILVLPTSNTATVTWANQTSGVMSISLEEIDEKDDERSNSELIDSKEYDQPMKKGMFTFKNLEPLKAYSITVTYEDGTETKQEFRTLPKINLNKEGAEQEIVEELNEAESDEIAEEETDEGYESESDEIYEEEFFEEEVFE